MKISLMTPFWKTTTGGISKYVVNLTEAYRKDGNDVYILTTDGGDGALILSGLKPLLYARALKYLFMLKPNVVHIHSKISFIIPALLYRLIHQHSRVVFTFHTQPYIGPSLPISKLEKPTYAGSKRWIAKCLLNHCDYVTAVSESLFQNLEMYSGIYIKKNSKKIIPGGVQIPKISITKNKATRIFNIVDRYPVLSTIGVLAWDWKVAGVKICIEAMTTICTEYQMATLVIAGDGNSIYRNYLENIVSRLDLQNNVLFLGNIKNIEDLLLTSDFYLHMALNEACPLSILEAMVQSKTIIATNRGGIPEIIENGVSGILVDPLPDKVAESVLLLTKDTKRAEFLGERAHKQAVEKYSWERIAQLYCSLFEGE